MRLHDRRPFLLLEILIAFTLVALCALPLISPHVSILKEEKQFISEVELDHLASLLFADRLQKLYQNEIPWDVIESERPIPIEESMYEAVGYGAQLPYKGTYHFKKDKCKISKDGSHAVYLMHLVFSFAATGRLQENASLLTYTYNVVIERFIT